ncbi:MAG TPA: BrnA antitoxin family protein [Dissulfurispiraceae bacterium]|nr:BrnA antitoxin family protein [Dissulfurispiraceae bacterium]
MKTLNHRKNNTKNDKDTRDNFELPAEIDFTRGVRGRFYRPKKISTTIRIDDDIILFFRRRASEQKSAYQTLVNEALRDYKTRIETAAASQQIPCEK